MIAQLFVCSSFSEGKKLSSKQLFNLIDSDSNIWPVLAPDIVDQISFSPDTRLFQLQIEIFSINSAERII